MNTSTAVSKSNKPVFSKELRVSNFVQIASESEAGLDPADYKGAIVYNDAINAHKYSNGVEWAKLKEASTFLGTDENDLP